MSYEQLISGHKWTVPTLYYAFPDSPYQIDYYLNPLTGSLQSFVSDAFTSMPNFQSLSPAQQGVVTQLLAPEITPNNSYGVGFSAVISGIDFQPGTITESQIIAFRGNFAPTPDNPAVTEKGHAFKPPSQALGSKPNKDIVILV